MRRYFVPAILVLLPFAAGATSEAISTPPVVPDASTAAPIEEVLVEAPEPRYVAPTQRDRIGRIWAPVLINGQGPFRLVLDTGASNSAIISKVADALGIPLEGSAAVRVMGVTGSAVVSAIAVDRLEVGDLLIDGTVLPVVADVFGGAEGVLGSEGLSDKRIHIDFTRDHIEIARSRSQRAESGFHKVPLKLARGRLLTIQVLIGSVQTTAIIDTGSQLTIGNSALREALLRRVANQGISQDFMGVTLEVARGDSIATPPVSFGGVVIRGLYVTFSDMFIFEHWRMTREPTLLLGMDVLGSVDTLIIDYKLRELHIRPRR